MMAVRRKRAATCLRNLVADFFDYETPVMLRTKAKRVGVIYRVIQTATLIFFFLYYVVYLKGYQLISDSEASVILTMVQGEPHDKFASLVYDEKFLQYCKLETESNNPDDPVAYFHGGRDISIPIDFEWMTQRQARCPEDPMVPGAKCNIKKNKCVKNKHLPMGNGKMTGKCVPAIIANYTVCEVFAWCPVISSLTKAVDVPQKSSAHSDEGHHDVPTNSSNDQETSDQTDDDYVDEEHFNLKPPEGKEAMLDLAQFAEHDRLGDNATEHEINGTAGIHYEFHRMQMWVSTKNVTIVIKNPVVFSEFKESRSNYNTSGIPCWKVPNYDMVTKHCPVFSVEDILEDVADKIDNVSAKDLMQTGGVVSCVINWECNLDLYDKDTSCSTKYTFTRVDQPRSGVGQRTLFLSDHEGERMAVRVSFIRFIFNVDVTVGKFSAIQLLFKLGAAFGLFSIATLLCEYIFLNTDWLVKRTVVEMKYLEPTNCKNRTKGLVVVQSGTGVDDQENDETSH